MANGFDILNERGFIYQLTDDKAIGNALNSKPTSFYLGIDPTADSLHIGHLLPLMAARWLQSCGHRPIILIGGATAMIGDPSGKTEIRKLLTTTEITENSSGLVKQISRIMNLATLGDTPGTEITTGNDGDPPRHGSFSDALVLNNTTWLADLNYLEFLGEFGRHFSVNRMLTADSVKLRLEQGLSFLEFNYMLLQAYDFLVLYKEHECGIQLGGQDQWGNIVAGVELIRRALGKSAYGLTLPLLTDRNDQKFGKTVDGAIWLDSKKTSVFDYYQFWRNTDDADVTRLLALFTTLPIDEVQRLGGLADPDINRAKEILAFEATSLIHGQETAEKTFLAVSSQFGFADPEAVIPTSSAVALVKSTVAITDLPTISVGKDQIEIGYWIVKLFVDAGLGKSNGDVRRLIDGGGAYLNEEKVTKIEKEITLEDFTDGVLLIRAGKKNIRRIVIA